MKICTKCKLNKELSEFNKRSSCKDGLNIYCKICHKFENKIIRENLDDNDKENIANYSKNWRDSRTNEQIKEKRVKANEWHKDKYNNDINYRLARILRGRFKQAIKNNWKTGSAIDDLGCSIEIFKVYIEKQFEPWMNWDNYGIYDKNKQTWQIDHINALANFNLENREELLKVCHYSNMRPLLALDNIKKSNH